jgi:hypothetical protein
MVARKDRRLFARVTQMDIDKLRTLAESAGTDGSTALRALVRTGTVTQVLRGIERAKKIGLRRAP